MGPSIRNDWFIVLGWGFAADEYLHLDLADLVLTQIGLGYDRRPP
jgi:hypothetical protein